MMEFEKAVSRHRPALPTKAHRPSSRPCHCRRWELAHGRSDVRPGINTGDHVLDLAPALVPGRIQQRLVVLRSEFWRQQADGGEMDRPVGEPLENQRESPRRSGGFDAVECRMLRQMQHLHAVRKQARTAFAEVK